MTRIYLGVGAEQLRQLAAGERLDAARVVADTEDEQDATLTAAEDGPVVVAAEVANAEDLVGIDEVEALHVDVDGSGVLAWFAPEELESVLALPAVSG